LFTLIISKILIVCGLFIDVSEFPHWIMISDWILIGLLTVFISVISGAEIAAFSLPGDFNEKSQESVFHIKYWLQKPDELRFSLKLDAILFKSGVLVLLVLNFFVLKRDIEDWNLLSWSFVLMVTFFYVIVVELFPKYLASVLPQSLTKPAVAILSFVLLVMKPVNQFAFWIKSFPAKNSKNEDVSNITQTINNKNSYSEEKDIVRGIVKFGNIDVRQILQPRINVIAVDYNNTMTEVLNVVIDSEYSRIPVYKGSFDNVEGILYVKDLLPHLHKADNFNWQTLIRPPYFVPESKSIKELLNEFKANKIHMAVVVDEYGGTLGIVTLEDILEEIVGDISDESDEEEIFFTKVNENTFIFDAKIMLNDFCKVLHLEMEYFTDVIGDADTLAGLILEIKGEIPEKSEEIKYKNLIFKIESVDSRRIKQIKVVNSGIEA
jgi:putative hemolysin